MATNNSINNQLASTSVTINSAAATDSVIDFKVNGSEKFQIGDDNSDSDSFAIAPATVGTSNDFHMTSSGQRSLPKQSAFLGFLGTADTDKTGAGATYTLGSGNTLTIVFDQNSNFVNTGTFTAPVTGHYYLSCGSRWNGVPANVTTLTVSLVASNRTIKSLYGRGATTIQLGRTFSVLVDMDTADTATLTSVASGGATNTADAFATTAANFISGFLAT